MGRPTPWAGLRIYYLSYCQILEKIDELCMFGAEDNEGRCDRRFRRELTRRIASGEITRYNQFATGSGTVLMINLAHEEMTFWKDFQEADRKVREITRLYQTEYQDLTKSPGGPDYSKYLEFLDADTKQRDADQRGDSGINRVVLRRGQYIYESRPRLDEEMVQLRRDILKILRHGQPEDEEPEDGIIPRVRRSNRDTETEAIRSRALAAQEDRRARLPATR